MLTRRMFNGLACFSAIPLVLPSMKPTKPMRPAKEEVSEKNFYKEVEIIAHINPQVKIGTRGIIKYFTEKFDKNVYAVECGNLYIECLPSELRFV